MRSEEDWAIIEILVFYFIHIWMVITQNYGLIWKGFSEDITAGISTLKAVKNILECPSKLLQDPSGLGYK